MPASLLALERSSGSSSSAGLADLQLSARLTCGSWTENIRNPAVFWVRLAMFVMLCLMIGTMYLRISTDAAHTQVGHSMLV